MIRRFLRWVPALRTLNPLISKNGWKRVHRGNFQLINIYEHEATNKIGGFIVWMFEVARSFNQPLNKWNVSNVRTMIYMFYEMVQGG